MQVQTILNFVEPVKSFVYRRVSWADVSLVFVALGQAVELAGSRGHFPDELGHGVLLRAVRGRVGHCSSGFTGRGSDWDRRAAVPSGSSIFDVGVAPLQTEDGSRLAARFPRAPWRA